MIQTFGFLGHPGRRRVALGHPLNTLWHLITKKSHNVLSKFMTLCWATFVAILCHIQPTCRGLATPERPTQMSALWWARITGERMTIQNRSPSTVWGELWATGSASQFRMQSERKRRSCEEQNNYTWVAFLYLIRYKGGRVFRNMYKGHMDKTKGS